MNKNELQITGGIFKHLQKSGIICHSIAEQHTSKEINRQQLRNEDKFSDWTYEAVNKRVTIDFDNEKCP